MYPGVSTETIDKNGNTLLIIASINGNIDIVKYLLRKNANVNAVNVYFLSNNNRMMEILLFIWQLFINMMM